MNKRNTIQRSLILDVVNRMHTHVVADEVYEAVIKIHPAISKATVYRNLNQLAESGQILKVEVPNGADCFEALHDLHYHVKCLDCGRIFDVELEYMKDLEKAIKNNHGFEFSGHEIMFKGVCPECIKRRNESKAP